MNTQIKSKERVREKGEVFTNEREVKGMCDLIPDIIWQDITKTFLEPSCGTGNFLIEILERKLKSCNNISDGLTAVKSIYGIDIMQDNVDTSKQRMINLFKNHFADIQETDLIELKNILDSNILCGDALKIMKEWETNIDIEGVL